MNILLAYGLMAISASFYCTFDAVIKEKTYRNSNNLSNNVTFNAECEIYECLGNTLNLYKNGKLNEDGFLSTTAVFSNFNDKTIDVAKTVISACISEVNQKLNVIPKCSKFPIGMKLLDLCFVEKKEHIKLLN